MANKRGKKSKVKLDVNNSSIQISEKKQDIKYDTRDYVVNYLIQQYEVGDFYIPLEYQRKFIWGDKEKCFFIESILMGLPIPFMFFADTDDGRIEIVDGAQRTQTLIQFAQNDLELHDLDILTESNGFKFEDLEPAIKKRFLNTNIRVVFLEEGTTQRVRQEIFKRINTGGVKANPTETRRGSFDGKFKDFLENCVKNKAFNKLAPRTKLTEDRYEGFELASRFFAYSDNFENEYKDYKGSVTGYIDDYIKTQNKYFDSSDSVKITNEYKKKFESMLTFASTILGERGFRKSSSSKSTPRARFEALAVGIALALKEKPDLRVIDVLWIEGEEFAIWTKSDAANNKNRLIGRIEYVKNKLLEGE